MDVLTDDQGLQGVLDRDLGLDNPGLDFPSDLEDIIFKGDGSMCLPDDAITLSALAHSAGFSNGSCALSHHNLSGQGQNIHPNNGHVGDPQGQRHLNGLTDQITQQLQYHQSLQQQQQQHTHQPSSCDHQQHQNHQGHHHQQHQQHQQQQQQQQQQHQQTSSYCSISGQPQLPYDGYDHSVLSHTSLPDSPPDSGSEPYSPPDGNLHQAMTDLKSTIPGSLPTIPQSMYLAHNNRMGGMPPNKAPPAYIGEPPKQLNHHHQGPPQLQQQQGQRVPMQFPMGQALPHQISPPLSHPILPAHMGSMSNIANQVTKKRKYSDSPTGTLSSSMMHSMNGVLSIKQEPPGAQFSSYMGDCSTTDDDLPPYDIDSNGAFIDSTYQVIKWQPYTPSQWANLTDGDFKDLPTPQYRVDADKGFNFSVPDEAFVCQKKNHFQVTVHMRLHGNAKYIRTVEGVKKIESFFLHFYGVKMESQNQHIKIEQSQSDRSKKSFHPVKVDLTADQETKVTVGRLHFSETTSNNMRKKGKPNPDQRYFLLVVSLHAHSGDKDHMLVGSVSDRIIVRASNPGQFDSDVDVMWQKGQTQESVYHMGRVGVNTDHPEEAMTIHGNIRLTGHMTQPSDRRAKENIEEIDPKNQLENVSKLRLYKYSYRDEYADHAGIPPDNREDTGVLAQEVVDVLPDAVQETGDVVLPNGETIEKFLVVNKDRIFMENVGAVKELCKLTDNLEVRIDQLEKMNKRLGKLKRFDSLKSTTSSLSTKSLSTLSTASSIVPNSSMSQGDSSHRSSKNTLKSDRGNNSSRSSRGTSLSASRSTLSSKLSPPVRKMCESKCFRIIIISLVVVLTFCLATLAGLYIVEHKKSHSTSSESAVSDGYHPTPAFPFQNSTSGISTTFNPSETDKRTSTFAPVSSSSTTTTQRATTRSTLVTLFPTTTRPGYQPVVPPYPACSEGYCEKLCCPPPHEDVPVTPEGGKDNPPYVIDHNHSGQQEGEIGWPNTDDVDEHIPRTTKRPALNTVIVNIPVNTNGKKENYNVINRVPSDNQGYQVVSHLDNRQGMNGLYRYRKKRGADDAPRPVIKIVELNYTIGDVFCRVNGCQNNNFSYYVPLNSYFGYGNITLEFTTPTMSYFALCHSRFMWNCPSPASQNNEINGDHVQQTDRARWTVRIGNHFRTIFNFRIIHSLKGHSVSVNDACSLENDENYVIMNYTIQFQRQC